MSDLIKRLRTLARIDTADSEYTQDEHIAGIAADHIEALKAKLARVEALQTYACMFGGMMETVDEPDKMLFIRLSDLKQALEDGDA